MQFSALIAFAGGVGLFLLGMRLMSDGLKVAAGSALRELLARATGSPLRALGSGALITGMVQSSSAVIFATIGFVNAGLLTLGQAVGVIFGANLGTTLTSWIVALVGFNVNLQALAMPAVALGMAGWIAGRGRAAPAGQALVGFGIFFLGLDVLKGIFADADPQWMLGMAESAGQGALRTLLFASIGILLTLLMQSSSAALAVTLTAAAGGMLPLTAAAAMVVGANVGTTSTALFATIGATAAARRTAAAHVVFNLVAGLAALLLLPWLVGLSSAVSELFGQRQQLATVLAIFHTLSNLLGVLIIWPFIGQLVKLLERCFGGRERDPAVPHYLDRTVVATPLLALDALVLELGRIGGLALDMARRALDGAPVAASDQRAVEHLGEAVIGFASQVNSGGDPEVDAVLPDAVRAVQYYRAVAELAVDLGQLPPINVEAEQTFSALYADAQRALAKADPLRSATLDGPVIEEAAEDFERGYQQAKSQMLQAGSRGLLAPGVLVQELDRISAMHRMVEQACKAAHLLARLAPNTIEEEQTHE